MSRYTAAAGGSVGTYNATSGAPIKQNLVTGLSRPEGIATLGNTVFVSILASGLGNVATYDATSGDPIKPSFITGMRSPYGLAVATSSGPEPAIPGRTMVVRNAKHVRAIPVSRC